MTTNYRRRRLDDGAEGRSRYAATLSPFSARLAATHATPSVRPSDVASVTPALPAAGHRPRCMHELHMGSCYTRRSNLGLDFALGVRDFEARLSQTLARRIACPPSAPRRPRRMGPSSGHLRRTAIRGSTRSYEHGLRKNPKCGDGANMLPAGHAMRDGGRCETKRRWRRTNIGRTLSLLLLLLSNTRLGLWLQSLRTPSFNVNTERRTH